MPIFLAIIPLLLLVVISTATDAQAQACTRTTSVAACGNEEFLDCTIDVGGVDREFCLHNPRELPPPATGHARPVVFVFHGGAGNRRNAVAFVDHLTEQDIIFIVPQALESDLTLGVPPATFSSCAPLWRHLTYYGVQDWVDFANPNPNGCGPAGANNDHDLQLVEALLDEADTRYDVLGHYALGFSNGAGMALQLMITDPLAQRFSGFGLIANGITQEKVDALGAAGAAPWFPNSETLHPTMLIWGTADKFAIPSETIISDIDAKVTAGTCPVITDARSFMECYMLTPTAPATNVFDYFSRIDETAFWLVIRNGAFLRAVETTYADKGRGDGALLEQDITIGVRQDYVALEPDSEPVSVITVVGGNHEIPGKEGANAPCGSNNCDFRAINEILDFWRSHAGFETQWK